MKRNLTLKSEYLAPLTTDEMSRVAGGAVTTQCFTGVYPSINRPCPTLDGCIELAALPSVQAACPTTDCFTGTSGHTLACG